MRKPRSPKLTMRHHPAREVTTVSQRVKPKLRHLACLAFLALPVLKRDLVRAAKESLYAAKRDGEKCGASCAVLDHAGRLTAEGAAR
jgi:hypothetical protein